MSDEQQFDDGFGAETEGIDESPRGTFFQETLLKILKWVGLVVLAVIFVATISWVVYTILPQQTTQSQTRAVTGEEYTQKPASYNYFSIDQIQGQTEDTPSKMFQISVYLGYSETNKAALNEITKRQIQIRDEFLFIFSRKKADELTPQMLNTTVKRELRTKANDLLPQNYIKDVRFENFLIID